eukprot:CAMPEP_0206203394 /NCGR_PEP_ID=MMETSP0166-20121206/12816_1 /ASSEMBLY_ACC=CAM_ASM_000260 /TAXON_ID=95228 /ORGANISM="Vannella robusta, Strain DIVA3 518/3/11/1/6" /LENGTH=277 /DNA_ID=CAMNT_0053622649 /DNA_START=172 /DNA_END=1005 /DNA_ORIENTATION=-
MTKDTFSLTNQKVLEHLHGLFEQEVDEISNLEKNSILKFFTNNVNTTFYIVILWYNRWGSILFEQEYRLKFKADHLIGIFPSIYLVGEEQYVSDGCHKGYVFLCQGECKEDQDVVACICHSADDKNAQHLKYKLNCPMLLAFEFSREFDVGEQSYNPDTEYKVTNISEEFKVSKRHSKPRIDPAHLPDCPKSFTVVVHSGSNLMPADDDGKSDPFVVLEYDGDKKKTDFCKNTLNPEWDKKNEFTFKVRDCSVYTLYVTVNDRDKFRDDFMYALLYC